MGIWSSAAGAAGSGSCGKPLMTSCVRPLCLCRRPAFRVRWRSGLARQERLRNLRIGVMLTVFTLLVWSLEPCRCLCDGRRNRLYQLGPPGRNGPVPERGMGCGRRRWAVTLGNHSRNNCHVYGIRRSIHLSCHSRRGIGDLVRCHPAYDPTSPHPDLGGVKEVGSVRHFQTQRCSTLGTLSGRGSHYRSSRYGKAGEEGKRGVARFLAGKGTAE